jgi:hypothetical protein
VIGPLLGTAGITVLVILGKLADGLRRIAGRPAGNR